MAFSAQLANLFIQFTTQGLPQVQASFTGLQSQLKDVTDLLTRIALNTQKTAAVVEQSGAKQAAANQAATKSLSGMLPILTQIQNGVQSVGRLMQFAFVASAASHIEGFVRSGLAASA